MPNFKFLPKKLNFEFVKDTSLYIVSAGLSKILTLVLIPFLTTYLSVKEFGTYDFLLILISFLSIFFSFGLPQVLQLEFFDYENQKRYLNQIFSAHFLVGCFFLFIISLALLIFLNATIEYPLLVMLFVSATAFLSFYQNSFQNILRLRAETKFFFFQSLIVSVLQFLTFFFVLKYLPNKVVWLLAVGLLCNFIGVFVCYRKLGASISFKNISLKPLFEKCKLGATLVFSYGAYWLINGADRLIVLKIAGEYQQGIYSIAVRLGSIAEPLLITPLISVLLPTSFNRYKEKNYQDKIGYWFLGMFCVFLLAAIIAPYTLPYFLSKNTPVIVYKLTPYFIVSYCFYFIAQLCGNVFVYHKKFKLLLFNVSIISVISVILNIILIKEFKLYGSAIAFLLINILWAALAIYQRWRFIKILSS